MGTVIEKLFETDFFFQQLAEADSRLLLIDYDGTIAPFQTNRKQAIPYPGVPELLDYIMSNCRTRVVVISARSAREVASLLSYRLQPEIYGSYGLERISVDGSYEIGYIGSRTAEVLAEAATRLENVGLVECLEQKAGAVALHWRGMEQKWVEEIRTNGYRCLAPLACLGDLLLTEFDGGMELKTYGSNKRGAVSQILSETGENPAIAYLGDDYSDEDAFRFVNECENDQGLSVLVRPEYRKTAAQVWLKPPQELLRFLTSWIRVCRGDR